MTDKTIFHITEGASLMAEIDANRALRDFPAEWSYEPWPQPVPALVIPADWRSLTPPTQRKLAIKFGAAQNIPPQEVYGFLAGAVEAQEPARRAAAEIVRQANEREIAAREAARKVTAARELLVTSHDPAAIAAPAVPAKDGQP